VAAFGESTELRLGDFARSSTGQLRAPLAHETKLRFIPYAPDVWCPLLLSRELRRGSVKCVSFLGRQLALFRCSDSSIAALLDRCPHRGIALSLGRVCGTAIQCAYHGWKVDGSGRVLSAPGVAALNTQVRAEGIEVRERAGVIWAFAGARSDAASLPLPDLTPYGTKASVDILMRKNIRAHWSFVLDNALDLFHQHLHRDIAFFFRVETLEHFASVGKRFDVHYRASMSSAYGMRRRGELRIQVNDNVTTLNLNGFPIIHSVATPRSADGLEQTLWWFIACPGSRAHRLFTYIARPLLRRYISKGFDQDVMILESEQRAFENGLRMQQELNPAVIAAHQHLNAKIVEFARTKGLELGTAFVDSKQLLQEARAGSIAVLVRSDGRYALAGPAELEQCIGRADTVRVARHGNVVAVCAD
jgi:phenylpropionate dioxygenase-like ring-hydroxylating dioxygenase large terminal subunit